MLRNKSRIILVLIIGIALCYSILMQSWIGINETFPLEKDEFEDIQGSDSWILSGRIHVNANWSATESTYDWCTGAGTSGNPYVIENVTIDAQGKGTCIDIHVDDFSRLLASGNIKKGSSNSEDHGEKTKIE